MSYRRFLLGALVSTLGIIFAERIVPSIDVAKRAAIIVSGGDKNEPGAFLETQRLAMLAYEKLGYNTVLVGGASREGREFSEESFIQAIKDFGHVDELRIDFIGHGTLAELGDVPEESKLIKISKARRSVSSNLYSVHRKPTTPLIWMAVDTRELSEGFAITSLAIRSGIAEFRRLNPSSRIEVRLTNCYSGAVSQFLRHEAHVIVFSASPANDIALSSSLNSYYEVLLADSTMPIANRRPAEQRSRAREQDFEFAYGHPEESYHRPRSPLYENVIGWCESEPEVTTAFAPAPAQTSRRESSFHRLSIELERRRASMTRAMTESFRDERFEYEHKLCLYDLRKGRRTEPCHQTRLAMLEDAKANFDLDEACFAKWKRSAPQDELENFDRIFSLMEK